MLLIERDETMRLMSDKDINRSLSNVKATLAVEGLNMPRRSVIDGRKYLRGELSSQQAIDNIRKYILEKSGQ